MLGNRGIYDSGWMASTTPKRLPWQPKALPGADDPLHSIGSFTTYLKISVKLTTWRSRTPTSYGSCRICSGDKPPLYNMLPLDARFAERADPAIRPSLTRGRGVFTYYPGMPRIPEGSTPDVKNKSHTITAEIEIPQDGAYGILATQGGRFGGWGAAGN